MTEDSPYPSRIKSAVLNTLMVGRVRLQELAPSKSIAEDGILDAQVLCDSGELPDTADITHGIVR